MLVLTRKIDQRIRIGSDVEVVVLGIEGDHVKLGIQAPRQIPVLRYELVQDVQEENRRAARVPWPAGVPGPATGPRVREGSRARETAASSASALPQHSLLQGLAALRPPGTA